LTELGRCHERAGALRSSPSTFGSCARRTSASAFIAALDALSIPDREVVLLADAANLPAMSPPDDGPLLAVDAPRLEASAKRSPGSNASRRAASALRYDNCGDVECAKYRRHVLVGEPA
jgi:hypothetical protein